jgi:hypothetical protein
MPGIFSVPKAVSGGGGGAAELDYINVQRDFASDVVAAYAAAPPWSLLYCPKGVYQPWNTATFAVGSKPVTFKGDVNGGTVWQGPSSRDGVVVNGSMSGSVALTADATRGTIAANSYLATLVVTPGGITSLGIVAGDYVFVGSTKVWEGTLQNNRHGETVRVLAVDLANNKLLLESPLAMSYLVSEGAYIQKQTNGARTVFEGIDFQNTTPQAGGGPGAGSFVVLSYTGPGTRISDCEMRDCDSRGVLFWYALGSRAERIHFKDFKGNPAQSYNAYGVSFYQASQWCVVADCTSDNIWEMVTTNGSDNAGVPRYNVTRDCECRNPFSAGFGMHEEGQHNLYENLTTIGGHEKAAGAVVARGMSVRHRDAIVKNFTGIGNLHRGFWVREDTDPGVGSPLTAGRGLRARGIHIRDQHWYSGAGSIAVEVNADDCVLEDVSVDGVDDYALSVGGSRNHIEIDGQRVGLGSGEAEGNFPIGRFAGSASDNTIIVKRARNASTGAVWGADSSPSGMARNRVILENVDQNIPLGLKTWMQGRDPIQWAKAGAQVVATAIGGRIYIQQYRRIRGIWIMLGTAPTGAAFIVDLNKNGTTAFTTQGNRPTIAIGAFVSAIAFPDIDTLAPNDYLTIDTDQVGSTIAGSDLQVVVDFAV